MCGEVHQAKGLHELIDIYTAVLVEVHALGQVHDGLVPNFHFKMRAQEFPSLTELLKRDQTCKNGITVYFNCCSEHADVVHLYEFTRCSIKGTSPISRGI
ncbi:hypothetical protein GOODEAATRI_011535 [Goodea atripinnis]|uniref:Uncharacterized protein n=1 Tax=Goodea atripinnis TaxID=208336 RepID=A0ABV0NTR5_9TELE